MARVWIVESKSNNPEAHPSMRRWGIYEWSIYQTRKAARDAIKRHRALDHDLEVGGEKVLEDQYRAACYVRLEDADAEAAAFVRSAGALGEAAGLASRRADLARVL